MAKFKQFLRDSYGFGQPLVNVFPSPVIAQRSPATTDIDQPIGRVWINVVSNQAWILTSVAAGAATWALASPGASDVDTINGLSPVAGNIVISGGTNLTDVNAGNTVTLNLDPAITLATSVTSPLYTAGAGVDTLITAPAGQDIVLRMGDAAGVTGVSFESSTPAEVFRVDSTGVMTMAGLTVTGAFTQTGGIANIGTDAAANAINIGTGGAAKPIIIGNIIGATAITLNSGTGGVAINSTGAGDIVLTSSDTVLIDSAGVLELNSSAGVIGIGNDAVAQNINIGTGAAQRTITIGNATLATSVVVNGGTGAMSFGANATDHTTTIGSTNGVSATNLQAGTGALAVNGGGAVTVDSVGVLELNSSAGVIGIGNDAVAQNMNIGTGAAQRVITIGNATLATSVVVNGGTGAMSFGANATDHTTTLGSTNGVSATNLQAGTGAMTIVGGGIMDLDCAGALSINSSAGVINVGNDVVAQNINIGTGGVRTITIGDGTGATSVVVDSGTGAASFGANATDHTTTIGSVTGVSSTVLQAGTAGFTMTGTINDMTAKFQTITGERITFTQSPLGQSNANTGVAPTGATGDVNLLSFQNGIIMEQFILGAGQTIIVPRMDANGLLVSLDLTNAEGAEYNWGAARANSKHSFTIGTSPAFYLQWRFRIADVSGLEPCYIGFRKTQANDATLANYTDFVAYGPNDGISPGDCAIETQLNTGGLVTTDTNDAFNDGATHTLRINVSAAGVVTFLFDGAPPTVTQAYTFDNGDVVHPFFRFTFNAVAPGAIEWISMECGNQ